MRFYMNALRKDGGSTCDVLEEEEEEEHGWLTAPLFLSPRTESLLRMKEEPAEVDEFTFSQGTSDQESNGSGSYYIKQEPWGRGWEEAGQTVTAHPQSGSHMWSLWCNGNNGVTL